MKKTIKYLSILIIMAVSFVGCCKEDFETEERISTFMPRYVYVSCADADSVSVIDAVFMQRVTNLTGETIGADMNEPRNPDVSPNGALAYVPVRHSDNVLVINTASNSVIISVEDTSFDEPYAVIFKPDNSEVWVVNKKGGGSSTGSITIISTINHSVIGTINDSTISSPEGICIANGKAYVANRGDGTVSVFNVSNRSFVANIDVGGEPRFIVTSPSGDFIYVTETRFGDLTKVRTSVDSIESRISARGRNAAMSPDGSKIFVASQSSEIHVVNTATEAVTDITIPGARSIYAVAILSDGVVGLATDEDNDVVYAFDPATGTLLNNGIGIPVGRTPRGIAAQ